MRIDTLLAVTLMRHGDEDAAVASMRRSLETGLQQQGFTRTDLDLLPFFHAELAALALRLDVSSALRTVLVSPVATASTAPQLPLLPWRS